LEALPTLLPERVEEVKNRIEKLCNGSPSALKGLEATDFFKNGVLNRSEAEILINYRKNG